MGKSRLKGARGSIGKKKAHTNPSSAPLACCEPAAPGKRLQECIARTRARRAGEDSRTVHVMRFGHKSGLHLHLRRPAGLRSQLLAAQHLRAAVLRPNVGGAQMAMRAIAPISAPAVPPEPRARPASSAEVLVLHDVQAGHLQVHEFRAKHKPRTSVHPRRTRGGLWALRPRRLAWGHEGPIPEARCRGGPSVERPGQRPSRGRRHDVEST
mmetsp:Transcript_47782/g.133083  ORF Transcript_47782/g.133083 Transcript_47782/m.133083 type:complete len:211 (-) Transcript_47782:275-907(-)